MLLVAERVAERTEPETARPQSSIHWRYPFRKMWYTSSEVPTGREQRAMRTRRRASKWGAGGGEQVGSKWEQVGDTLARARSEGSLFPNVGRVGKTGARRAWGVWAKRAQNGHGACGLMPRVSLAHVTHSRGRPRRAYPDAPRAHAPPASAHQARHLHRHRACP